MPTEYKRILVTSALPYANGPIHIGQLAGAYLPADIYVRYHRLKGTDVLYVCGSDEHGVAITLQARNENKTPQEIVDRYHALNEKSFRAFGISFDIYHRTSAKLHHETASEFFTTLYQKKVLFEEESEQYFDPEVQQFLADRYIVGTCPRCGFENAYGDQCEKCGTTLSPNELINPRSMLSGATPVLKKTRHWYLPLNEFETWLNEWIGEGHRDDWKTNVYGQCKSWLDHGLQPRAMTRDLDWGVPVPLPNAGQKVLYVWLDAPIGYISATKEWAGQNQKDWKSYWQDPETRLIHFIGKDNIVFHCIIFPVLLKAHGDYILPDNVPANEFMNMEGNKISTSRNWAVWLHEYLEDFRDRQDVLRYTLCVNFPETKDSEFTWKDFQSRNNNELSDIVGNFVNRTLTFAAKYFENKVPDAGELDEMSKEMLSDISTARAEIGDYIERFEMRNAVRKVMDLARSANKYFNDQEPWVTRKTDLDRCGTAINTCFKVLSSFTVLLSPFMPFTAERLHGMLNLETPFNEEKWDRPISDAFSNELGTPEILFPKIDDDVIELQIEKLRSGAKTTSKVN